MTKQEMYDRICALLTEYEENGGGSFYDDSSWECIFYGMLVDIVNAWEDVITADD